MAKALEGTELRVFRILVNEHQLETPERIRIELTKGPLVSLDEVETSLASLSGKSYAEEFRLGHWRLSSKGWAVRRSLQGLPIAA